MNLIKCKLVSSDAMFASHRRVFLLSGLAGDFARKWVSIYYCICIAFLDSVNGCSPLGDICPPPPPPNNMYVAVWWKNAMPLAASLH